MAAALAHRIASRLPLIACFPAPCAPPRPALQLKSATRQAAASTASMGKFDRLAKGEKAEDRQPRGKKRKFLSVADKVGGRVWGCTGVCSGLWQRG